MTKKRFGMYQNTLYDNGNILNSFNAMKLLNHFDKENAKLKEANEQLRLYNSNLMKKLGEYSRKVKELEKREEEKSCGHCKHFQLDGMFGIWCDKDNDWKNIDAEHCSDYERG